MSTLTKQIYRYTHPRSMRHNENLWPYVKIQRDKFGAISELFYKNSQIPLQNLSTIKESYNGRVLLTATGPSVKEIDFSSIPEIPTIGVNGAWYLHKEVVFNIYIIVDMTFIDNRPEILEQIIANDNLTLFTTMHGIVKLIDKFSLKKIKCKLAVIEDKCYRIFEHKIPENNVKQIFHSQTDIIFLENSNSIAFNYDIRTGIFDAGTVVYWALQILTYLGFDKIYIAGLDMNNFSSPRFYESPDDILPSFLDDKLHNTIIPAFQLARHALDNKNVELFNLSLDSAVPSSIFPKMDYRDAFN
ncbi:sugar glycosyltransferase [Buttiauxella sp.]|uniref:sugar glycosyltransferase n=1 Tax=Buttiauxella sp. TaxID=1972222 RepID=UPI003C725EB3